MIEKEYLNKCLQFIENKFGHGKSSEWKHSDINLLRDKIYEETNILMSVTSLKRLCGKTKSNHYPQLETRNALAKYAGFEDWDDFIMKNFGTRIRGRKKYFKKIAVFIIPLLLLITLIYFIQKIDFSKKVSVELTSSSISGTSPHTVVFNYSIPKTKEKIYIDFDDSFPPSKMEALDPERNTITHFYKLPDLYRVSLIHDNEILVTRNVHLKTKGWTAFYIDNMHKIYRRIENPFEVKDVMEISPEILSKNDIVINNPAYQIKFRYINDFGIPANKCSLKTRVKNQKVNDNITCYVVGLTLIGENGKIKINYSTEGCFNKALLQIDNIIENGHFTDLSYFDLDFSDWRDLEIKTHENLVKFYVDDQYITQRELPLDLGMVKGILVISDGWWSVDYINLSDLEGISVYSNDF